MQTHSNAFTFALDVRTSVEYLRTYMQWVPNADVSDDVLLATIGDLIIASHSSVEGISEREIVDIVSVWVFGTTDEHWTEHWDHISIAVIRVIHEMHERLAHYLDQFFIDAIVEGESKWYASKLPSIQTLVFTIAILDPVVIRPKAATDAILTLVG